MATRKEHRDKALGLIELAHTYGPSAAARLSVLAEAQIEATLALTAEDAAPDAPGAAEKPARRPRKAAPAKEADQ